MIFLKFVFALYFATVALALPIGLPSYVLSTLYLHQCRLKGSINYISSQNMEAAPMDAARMPTTKGLRSLQNGTVKRTLMVMLPGLSDPTVIVVSILALGEIPMSAFSRTTNAHFV
jgi:hypothetical protein